MLPRDQGPQKPFLKDLYKHVVARVRDRDPRYVPYELGFQDTHTGESLSIQRIADMLNELVKSKDTQ